MAPAYAGSVGSGDNLSLEIEGEYRFNIGLVDQDVSAEFGRGFRVISDQAEIEISAANTTDNGIEYGVTLELNALPSDVEAADEVYAFVDSDAWGRIEMGDQDDATSRMHVSTADVMVGRAGMDGDVADFFQFGSGGGID
ncbi:MAG: porin, partial [Gammaproteobacteria bacterium]|nr:porin [Gammaproteobacteria bacterium]